MKHSKLTANNEVDCHVDALSIFEELATSVVLGEATVMKSECYDDPSLRLSLPHRLQAVVGLAVVVWVGIAVIASVAIP